MAEFSGHRFREGKENNPHPQHHTLQNIPAYIPEKKLSENKKHFNLPINFWSVIEFNLKTWYGLLYSVLGSIINKFHHSLTHPFLFGISAQLNT